jgi:hypothetical protein
VSRLPHGPRGATLALVLAAVVLGPAGPASAASVELGRVNTGTGQCSGGSGVSTISAMQDRVPAAGPSYTAPFDGVAIRWSTRTNATAGLTAKLRFWRRTADPSKFVAGAQSNAETLPVSVVKDFDSQVQVKQGDVLGATFQNNANCIQTGLGPDFKAFLGNDQDPATGADATFGPSFFQGAANISARVETDNDGDLLGDDSQDTDDDNDNVSDFTDNCPLQANAGQENTDAQAGGDACDDDDDDDGLTDAAETELGTNPKVSDTDGDGLSDGRDRCPAEAGLFNGCPPLPDTVPPGVKLTGIPARIRRAALLSGRLRFGVEPSEPAAVEAELLATARGARLAQSFNLVLAKRSLPLGNGRRRVVLRPARRLVGRARRFKVRVRVTVTDASGNRRLVTRTIRVR